MRGLGGHVGCASAVRWWRPMRPWPPRPRRPRARPPPLQSACASPATRAREAHSRGPWSVSPSTARLSARALVGQRAFHSLPPHITLSDVNVGATYSRALRGRAVSTR
eukprot:7322113-Prymnesium_polylepis.1